MISGPDFALGPARARGRMPDGSRGIAVAEDGRRFLALIPAGTAPPRTVTVLQGWTAAPQDWRSALRKP